MKQNSIGPTLVRVLQAQTLVALKVGQAGAQSPYSLAIAIPDIVHLIESFLSIHNVVLGQLLHRDELTISQLHLLSVDADALYYWYLF